MKRCFNCKEEKPLKDFIPQPKKDHMIASQKGCSINCRKCTYEWIMDKGEKLHPYRKITKYQGELRRFTSFLMNEDEANIYCYGSDIERKELVRSKLKKQGLLPFNE